MLKIFGLISNRLVKLRLPKRSSVGSAQTLAPLQLVFDSVHLEHSSIDIQNYRPAWALKLEKYEAYRVHPSYAVSRNTQEFP